MRCGVGHRSGLDPVLLWLWCRTASEASIRPLAWELPYATSAVLKRKKKIDEYIGRDSVSDGERNPGSHNVSVLSLSKISNPNMLDLMK